MKTIITIGRQYGSAGHSIGKILADGLGIKYYDKELLERAAKGQRIMPGIVRKTTMKKPTNSFLYSLVMDSYSFGYGSTMMDMPLNQKVFLAQFDAIKEDFAGRSVCHRRPLCRYDTGRQRKSFSFIQK